MIQPIALTLLAAALAFASGTTTPKPGGARCATSTLEGSVGKVDAERKIFAVVGPNRASREFKVSGDTIFRIPGATQEQLKNAPLSKVTANARVKVSYCTKDGSPVEVKIER